MATAKSLIARVLVDILQHGLRAGQLVEAEPALIEQLKSSGAVDPHEDAVAYARSEGAAVVKIEPAAKPAKAPKQAKTDAAAVAALKEQIAKVEEQLAAAPDEEKPALQEQLDELRSQLA